MFERVRQFLAGSNGLIVAAAIGIIALFVLIWSVRGTFGESEGSALSRERTYIDAKTLKVFSHDVKIGEIIPVQAPSGGKTGYPAEMCFWTKDGKIKDKPTPVLLNEAMRQPGPTFCPDCGRLVVGHNPSPTPGGRPPPTKEEYYARTRH